MATIQQNREYWNQYDWSHAGDEWSAVWGGSDVLWNGSLWPRVRSNLPASTVVEIAPGFGRMTAFLIQYCDRYVGVDLAETCVEACRKRFKGVSHAEFRVGDGVSLSGIDSCSVDFVFSWDSLVHAEAEVLRAYIFEVARVLRPGGSAFIHHSNLKSYADEVTGILTIDNQHWRGESMDAGVLRKFANEAGILCMTQEIVNWGGPHLTDCFSLLVARPPSDSATQRVIENPQFMDEAVALGRAAKIFDCAMD